MASWDEEKSARVKEMLGLTDLPFNLKSYSVSHRYEEAPKVQITFERELTPYEARAYQEILEGSWPPEVP